MDCLVAQGYQAIPQQSGIFPFLFYRKKEQPLFLFRAALDGRNSYAVEWTAESELSPTDFSVVERPTLKIPARLQQSQERATTRYYWLPRRLDQASPLLAAGMLTKQDVSELLGLALSTVQFAITSGDRRLVVSTILNNAPLFKIADVLDWNIRRMAAQRRRKTGDTYEKAYRSLCKKALITRILRDYHMGRVSEEKLLQTLETMYGENVGSVEELLTYLSNLKRRGVLAFLSEAGLISAPLKTERQKSK